MPSYATALILTSSGDVKIGKITLAANEKVPSAETIQKYYRRKVVPTLIGTYTSKDSVQLQLFGYKEGKAGQENKHELPPPNDKALLFGDIVLIAVKDGGVIPFTVEEYHEFYNRAFGGFDDLGSEDEQEADDASTEGEVEEEAVEDDFDSGSEGEDSDSDSEVEAEPEAEPEPEPEPKVAARAKAKKPSSKQGFSLGKNEVALTEEDIDSMNTLRKMAIKRFQDISYLSARTTDIEAMERQIYLMAFKESAKRGIVAHWRNPTFCEYYLIYVRTNYIHLTTLPNVKEKIISGEISLESLPQHNHYSLNPEGWHEFRERQRIREEKDIEGDRRIATDRFKCHRCGQKQCSYYQLQTRSADEPMTTFIKCLVCNKEWRQ
jgi:DNA-directed RNA polymerase subunit M/transcription elongation factor TFIIS